MMRIALISGMLAGAVASAGADNWTSWRGDAAGSGGLGKGGAPREFSAEKNLLWKTKLPGVGCSTPVVWEDRIILTSEDGDQDCVVAYDWKGKELWRKTLGAKRPGRGQRVGSGANSSPVTDGKHVFVYFKSGTVAALTLDGKKVWQTNLIKKYGPDTLWWDQGTSPVLTDGHLVIAVMQNGHAEKESPEARPDSSFLVAFEKESGDVAWKTTRQFKLTMETGDAYTTPHVLDIDGKETVVTWGADHLTGHDAGTGEQLWICGGFNPNQEKYWRVIASSTVANGICVVPYGRAGFMAGIRMGGSGDITKSAWLWKRELAGTDAASPAARDGKVYLLVDRGKKRGRMECLDAVTGKTIWEENLPKGVATYYGSPLVAGDALYCPREDGSIMTARITNDGLEEIRENKLGETVISSPAVVDGKLLIRGREHLYCFGES
ncbi:MAG: PQQ-binding-like beta-propeller repeat protein [Akkermansiaceae bacterium]|nr:PQQ-binding-like beta-propeller repeat protein [Akkermansiaceae bacterium]